MINIGSTVFDSLLTEAVQANFQEDMIAMPPEGDILREHPFSKEHIRRMDKLFSRERNRAVAKRALSFTRAAVIVICVLSTLLASLLMVNPQVRAAVRDAIVQFYNDHIRITFDDADGGDTDTPENPNVETKTAQDFLPHYLPDGYTLLAEEILGYDCFKIYMDENRNMFMLDVALLAAHGLDIEHSKYRTEAYDGITYHISETYDEDAYSNIVWTRNGFSFALAGLLPVGDLLQIARSVA